jgi:hypothetical protein
MMRSTQYTWLPAGARWLTRAASLTVLVGALAACDSLLEVDTPSRVPADLLENPANAELLVNSAIADFDCAFGTYVVLGGLIGEELMDATQTADRFPYDRRDHQSSDRRYAVNDCEDLGVYTPLNTARASADNVLNFLQNVWTDEEVEERVSLLATAATYAGYSLVLLGEGFCSGVISTFDENRDIVFGQELTPTQLLEAAVERFTTAIGAADESGNIGMLSLARLGRARALLGLGRFAEAQADAELIPSGFVALSTASSATPRRANRVFAQNNLIAQNTSVGEPYRSLNDPRVPVVDINETAAGTGIEIWVQTKYEEVSDPIPLATFDEAQLIIAEAELEGGDLPAALGIVNTYRARGNQTALPGGSTAQQIRDALIDQRRRELFLEGHHLGDIIRYDLTLSPPAGTAYHGSGQYGNQKCLPLPDVERQNNPNL